MQYIPIPPVFHSFETNKAFENCICCNQFLLETGTQYLIEKAIIQYPGTNVTDVIFEYAMCLGCSEKMRQSLSTESLNRISQYFAENVNFESRQDLLLNHPEQNMEDWIGTCLVKQTPVSETSEYQLMAYCNGEYLLYDYAPFMISGAVTEELSELLSPETKEVLDDFIDQFFGLPPELKELVKEKNLLLV